ncbi:hypothetical protein IAR55_005998 [Kwoniella newhampshirensis]|uniref:Zn(2)-C6 fungal-type domain-containing protein n=1 Tax=Kwoniella newhampshirensis TaxID=1651941 RepID=A0AAW0YUL2_9TREE
MDTPSSAPSSSKRKRASKPTRQQPIVSCLECRRMKWKCDRQFPCSNCRKRGIAALCPSGQLPSIKERHVALNDTTELRKRIAKLEKIIDAACRQGFNDDGPDEETQIDGPAATFEHRPSLADMTDVTDGDGGSDVAQGQLILGDEPGTSTFFGNGGAQYHLQMTGERLPSVLTGITSEPPPDQCSFPFQEPPAGTTVERLVTCLPERGEAFRWATIFFENTAILNHTLDQKVFFSSYLPRVYRSSISHAFFTKINNQLLAVVFLVICSGAAMDLELPPYNDTAERFFRLAKMSLSIDPSNSMAFVQAVHLMSRYTSNSFKGPKASLEFWSTLGMGTRCAQAIGLHRDGQNWRLNPDELELRRRIFWEIYTEDILQSMTQGRPRLIANATFDCALPSLKDESDIRLQFHHYKYLLVRILARVNDVQTNVTPCTYRKILEVHNDLSKFENELPSALRQDDLLAEGSPHSIPWHRLTLRLLNSEGYLFLHRAHFARALRDAPQEPMASTYRFSYVAELEASRVVLVILREALALNPRIASRFLVFFFHAFTAVVNFASVVIRSPRSSLAEAAFTQVDQGVALFESIPEDCRARNDLPTLRSLHEQARQALNSLDDETMVDQHDILGIGTKLVRLKRPGIEEDPASSSSDVPSGGIDFTLPTTLADVFAAAHQVDLNIQGFPVTATSTESQRNDSQTLSSDWFSSDWSNLFVHEPEPLTEVESTPFWTPEDDHDVHSFMVTIGLYPNE